MILEFFLDILCDLITNALSLINVVTLPSNLIDALLNFTSYGNYVVGADLLLVFSSSVFMWFSVKQFVGLVLFIWKLLPFT